ncbi:MAG: AmmeMemoRadiSam system protein B [Spirochaetota bacterium]
MIRPQLLPSGWYPRDPAEIQDSFRRWDREATTEVAPQPKAVSIVAPHAGWGFSGGPAYRALRRLGAPETVVIVGGHLGPREPVLLLSEEGFDTPFGVLSTNTELRERIRTSINVTSDDSVDNSVDVLLPMVAGLFPEASVVCLRAPANAEAIALGRLLAEAVAAGASVGVVGSTDLTHYGANFGFAPAGTGSAAVEWARENDRQFLDFCVAEKPHGALDHAAENRSACSPGAAAAAMAFAEALGVTRGTLLEHTSSYDLHPADSFVGYGTVAYSIASA